MKNPIHFLREIASAHDFPELLSATGVRVTRTAPGTEFVAVVPARGQWAVGVHTVLIKVTVWDEESAPGVVEATVTLSYQHTSGGSNGFSEYYMLAFEPPIRDGAEALYRGSCRRSVFSQIQQAFFRKNNR